VFNSNTVLTDTYVKVYLVKGKKCVEKHRTKTMKESLQPKYMEMLKFKSSPAGCLIQVRAFFNVFFFTFIVLFCPCRRWFFKPAKVPIRFRGHSVTG